MTDDQIKLLGISVTAVVIAGLIFLITIIAQKQEKAIIWPNELTNPMNVQLGFRNDGVTVWRELK